MPEMYSIDYLPVARQDIMAIALYISDGLKAPQAALDLLDAFERSILLLAEFPYAHVVYRPIEKLDEEYRLLPVNNYAILYTVREQEKRVEIRRVIYAKMDLTQLIK
jgi:plasmid stabilization system protein ParE